LGQLLCPRGAAAPYGRRLEKTSSAGECRPRDKLGCPILPLSRGFVPASNPYPIGVSQLSGQLDNYFPIYYIYAYILHTHIYYLFFFKYIELVVQLSHKALQGRYYKGFESGQPPRDKNFWDNYLVPRGGGSACPAIARAGLSSFVFIHIYSCPFVFIRVHAYLFVFIRVHSCPFVSIRVHSCSFMSILIHSYPFLSIHIHSYSFVSILIHSYSFVSIRVHSWL
jgi:hypothetical protein